MKDWTFCSPFTNCPVHLFHSARPLVISMIIYVLYNTIQDNAIQGQEPARLRTWPLAHLYVLCKVGFSGAAFRCRGHDIPTDPAPPFRRMHAHPTPNWRRAADAPQPDLPLCGREAVGLSANCLHPARHSPAVTQKTQKRHRARACGLPLPDIPFLGE